MNSAIQGSFRDPCGFLFERENILYRQVNLIYKEHYDFAVQTGLFNEFIEQKLLIPHREVFLNQSENKQAYVIIQPDRVPFISYPYEWSFGQFKEAALLTLKIQELALKKGMCLKDASAYNVQFLSHQPVFIDSLSFEKYNEGEPWIAYKQFCQHFLAPLALMSKKDVRLGQMMRLFIDGIPLDLACKLLPVSSFLNPGLGLHIFIHAKTQKKYEHEHSKANISQKGISKTGLLGLIDNLKCTIENLQWKPGGSEWFDYYETNHNYSQAGLQEKESLVKQCLQKHSPKMVWDLGGNTGRFSRIAAGLGAYCICWDIDFGCVEANFRMTQKNNESQILPLFLDLANPSCSLGWAGEERQSISRRTKPDLIMALGLIHHLTISNNVPLFDVANYFVSLSQKLLIEFIPKEDSQVEKLLSTRLDVFPNYTQDGFEQSFSHVFDIQEKYEIPNTKRSLYMMISK